jgi:hypothetical protein
MGKNDRRARSGVTREGLFPGFGFAESIAEESKEASVIKNETPIVPQTKASGY